MKLMGRFMLLGLALAAAGALLVACGGSDNKSSSGSGATATRPAAVNTVAAPAAATTAPLAATSAPPASAPLAVSVVDFSFNPAALTARAGQPVTINVTNNGNASHTFTVQGVTGADTGTISPGQSKSITFTPAAAGRLPFFCNIHGANIMSGAITVQ